MILIPHIFAGAALAALLPNSSWVILLAVVLHFLLDIIPHWEYLDQGFKLRSAAPKIALDFLGGILLIYLIADFSWWNLIIIFFSLLPDGIILLYALRKSNRLLRAYFAFNHRWHFILWSAEAQKKMWVGWKILTQIIVIWIAILIIYS